MQIKEQHLVAPLLVIALFSLTFLFLVAFTSSSFQKQEVAMPNIFSLAMVSPEISQVLQGAADNIVWSMSTIHEQAGIMLSQVPVRAFFGLEDYKFGQPRYTALQSRPAHDRLPADGQVLGAFLVNPEYAAGN